jgi:hypothetical protein
MSRVENPIYSIEVSTSDFTVPVGSTFLYSDRADEDRAIPSPAWFSGVNPNDVQLITVAANVHDEVTFGVSSERDVRTISLYDVDELRAYLENLPQPVYIDMTGLSHRTWAPLVRATHLSTADVRVIYLEPAEYLRLAFVDAQKIYDLSEKFDGLRPLPGFARLDPQVVDEGYFVPMIGFEGSRLEYVVSQSEPKLANTYPVVGVPGFRPDYAFFAFQSNRRSLERDFLQSRVQFAKANCPFDAFYLLREIHAWSHESFLRIAPIGTKPHALAAVLFAVANPNHVELIYDNPVRARNRTEGQARVLVYALSAFMKTPMFTGATSSA